METNDLIDPGAAMVAMGLAAVLLVLFAGAVLVRWRSARPIRKTGAAGKAKGTLAVSLGIDAGGRPGFPGLFPKLVIQVSGLDLPHGRVLYRLRTRLYDTTSAAPPAEGSGSDPNPVARAVEGAPPILSVVGEYRADDRGAWNNLFELKREISDGAPGEIAPERIPLDYLVFPRQGHRNVLAVTELFLDREKEPHAVGHGELKGVPVVEPGYLDSLHARWLADHLAVRLAVVMAQADGAFDRNGRERRVIEEWVERRLSGLGAEDLPARRAFLLEPLQEALGETGTEPDAASGTRPEGEGDATRFREIIAEMKRIATPPMLYEYASLCFDVMKADTWAHEAERELITRIQEVAGLDIDRCRALLELRLTNTQQDSMDRLWHERGPSSAPGHY